MPLGIVTGERTGWGVAKRAVGGSEAELEGNGDGSSRKSVPSVSTGYLELSVIEPAQKRPWGSIAPSLKRMLLRASRVSQWVLLEERTGFGV